MEARQEEARWGEARPGEARRGEARRGKARQAWRGMKWGQRGGRKGDNTSDTEQMRVKAEFCQRLALEPPPPHSVPILLAFWDLPDPWSGDTCQPSDGSRCPGQARVARVTRMEQSRPAESLGAATLTPIPGGQQSLLWGAPRPGSLGCWATARKTFVPQWHPERQMTLLK